MRRALLAALAALALAPATAAAQHGDHGAAPGGGTAVAIQFAAFDPPFVDVLTGDSIRWTNDSVRQHDVAAVDAAFNSGSLRAGSVFTHAFTAAGDVAYYCTIHPFMRGTVAVHDLLLDRPAEPAVPGRPFPLRGRTALPPGTPIGIEADSGTGATSGSPRRRRGRHVRPAALPHIPEQLRAVARPPRARPCHCWCSTARSPRPRARSAAAARDGAREPGGERDGGAPASPARALRLVAGRPRAARPARSRRFALEAAPGARPRRADARRRRDAAGDQRAAATRPLISAIAALWPGTPLTPPPRTAPAPHSSTCACAVSTPQRGRAVLGVGEGEVAVEDVAAGRPSSGSSSAAWPPGRRAVRVRQAVLERFGELGVQLRERRLSPAPSRPVAEQPRGRVQPEEGEGLRAGGPQVRAEDRRVGQRVAVDLGGRHRGDLAAAACS